MTEALDMMSAEKGDPKGPAKSVDLDNILEDEVGQFGKYQIVTLLLAAFPVMFSAFASGEYIFTTARINTRLVKDEKTNILNPLSKIN